MLQGNHLTKYSLIISCTVALAGSLFAQPTVSNVTAQQRVGTKIVDVSYDLVIEGGETATVWLRASRDGGVNYEYVPYWSMEYGSFGGGVSAGTGKTLVWEPGDLVPDPRHDSWGAELYPDIRVEVVATVAGAPPADMVEVEGGTLETDNALDGTEVETFRIGRYPVTWGDWKEVRERAAGMGYIFGEFFHEDQAVGCEDDHPVRSISWYDALKWANAKSEMEGLSPVYLSNESIFRTGEPPPSSITLDTSANGYRLPLEVEWEFAARGGNQSQGHTYSGGDDLDAVGWYRENSEGAACNLQDGRGTWPVGEKAANELGLHDMSGNIWEWCWDSWNDSSVDRVLRGGSWNDTENRCAVSYRMHFQPNMRIGFFGFRLALAPQSDPGNDLAGPQSHAAESNAFQLDLRDTIEEPGPLAVFGNDLHSLSGAGPDTSQWYFSFTFKDLFHFADGNWFYALQFNSYMWVDAENGTLATGFWAYHVFHSHSTWAYTQRNGLFSDLRDSTGDGINDLADEAAGDQPMSGYMYLESPFPGDPEGSAWYYFEQFPDGNWIVQVDNPNAEWHLLKSP